MDIAASVNYTWYTNHVNTFSNQMDCISAMMIKQRAIPMKHCLCELTDFGYSFA